MKKDVYKRQESSFAVTFTVTVPEVVAVSTPSCVMVAAPVPFSTDQV